MAAVAVTAVDRHPIGDGIGAVEEGRKGAGVADRARERGQEEMSEGESVEESGDLVHREVVQEVAVQEVTTKKSDVEHYPKHYTYLTKI